MNWNLTIDQKDHFLDLLNNLGCQHLYELDFIEQKLTACGIPVKIDHAGNRLQAGSIIISLTEPEWGRPGIYVPLILQAAIDDYGFRNVINSNMSGSGFHFRDCLEQLAARWGFTKQYL